MTPSVADPERAPLDARVLAWMRELEWRDDDARFERLALDLFGFQYRHCAPYRRFCRARGATPDRVLRWHEIPAVPTGAFKELALRCFPEERRVHAFRTSGTSTSVPGALELDTLELYEASLLPSFRRHVLPELAPGERMRLLVLTPSAGERPDSSLSYMFEVVLRELGTPEGGFRMPGDALDVERLVGDLRTAIRSAAPVALCGTAFAFVHLLDALERRGEAFALPAGSRIMETGGFKGRSREVPRASLYADLERRLGVPESSIVNQYGMTELGSQFYDSVLARPGEPRRKLAPPWTRVRIVDPGSGEPAPAGEVGAISVFDLANTGSVLALQTADLGRAGHGGFEVLGREPEAEQRGCSIAADAMLAESPR